MLEVELKLRITPDAVEKLQRSPFLLSLTTSPPEQFHLVTTYFDTANCDLYHNGIALRIREIDGHFIQTVKTNAFQEKDGLHQRYEWNVEVKELKPDCAIVAEAVVRRQLLELTAKNTLLPLFTTDFHRLTWDLHFSDGTDIEMAIDQGMIYCDDKTDLITEVELELRAGKVEKLYEVAEKLGEVALLIVENASKAERGYRLKGVQ